MTTNFKVNGVDTDLLYVRKEIFTQGGKWGIGANSRGQLGNNSTTSVSSPVQTVASGQNWYKISSGYQIFAGIKTDGTLWTCGYNGQGQLGDGTIANKSSPVQTVSAGTNWKKVSIESHQMAAIKTDGTLWMTGYN